MQLFSFSGLNIGSRDTVTLQQNGPSIPSSCRNNTPPAFPLPKRCYLEYFMVLSYYFCKDKSIKIHKLKMIFSVNFLLYFEEFSDTMYIGIFR